MSTNEGADETSTVADAGRGLGFLGSVIGFPIRARQFKKDDGHGAAFSVLTVVLFFAAFARIPARP
ncbi:hypothetical protein ACGFNU_33730 [Spirillospora sp. NPDC048911]|uniref:hypothetical protein n=1 Tax=Spirillospora sp. NPDC048911 TaxID=3364527 RepID=UPI003717BA04